MLIVASNYAPELTGIGKYVGEMAEWLVAAGAEVRVVTAPPHYPGWRVAAGYTGRAYRRERRAGVDVIRCPTYVPPRPGGVRRLLHLASIAASSLPPLVWSALAWRPDHVFVVEPPLACAPAAWLAARLAGGRAWLHVQDFEVDAAFQLGMLRSRRLRALATGVERLLLRRFDRVTTISERMRAKLIEKGVAPNRAETFPNWVDTASIRPLPARSPLRSELGVADGELLLLYSGNFGEKQGIELLLDVARALADEPGCRFVLCGEGPARPRLERAAAGLERVSIRPLQPAERLNELLNAADVHLLPQRADAEDLVMPSKLSAMLASGRPVIATASAGSELASWVRHVGAVVPPGDAGAFAAAVRTLAADATLRAACGARARQLAVDAWEMRAVLARAFRDVPLPGRAPVTEP